MLIDLDPDVVAKLLECVSEDVQVATNEATKKSSIILDLPRYYMFLLDLKMAQRLRFALEKASQC